MARRRRVFGQRRHARQRLIRRVTGALIAFVLLLALLYITLPWTSGIALALTLRWYGWGPVSLDVARIDPGGVELHDIALANDTVTVERLAVRFSLPELWHGHVREIALTGARVKATWSPEGPRIGTRLIAVGDRGTVPMIDRVIVADTAIAIPLGQQVFITNIAADLAAQENRWDGSVGLETRAGDATAPVARLAWEGTLAPAEPARWGSRAILDLNATDVALAEGALLSARGRLELTTGDGNIVVAGADRLAVNIGALPDSFRSGLPASLAKPLGSGVAVQIAGSSGGPKMIWRTTPNGARQEIDASVGLSLGASWVRAALRGETSGAGAIPNTLTSADLRFDANAFPTAVGTITGRARLQNMRGALNTAEGNLTTDITIADAVLGAYAAASARIGASGPVRRDGPTLAVEPKTLSMTFEAARGPAGITLDGAATVAVVTAKEPQSLVLDLGGAVPKLTLALTAGASALTIGVPRGEGREIVNADLPRARLEGSIAADRTYDLKVNAEGTLSHALADARLSRFAVHAQTAKADGSAEMVLTRFMGRASRGRVETGLKVQSNFKIDSQSVDLTAVLRSAQDAEIGRGTVAANLTTGQGKLSVDIPALRLGTDGIALRDILTGTAPVTSATGTVEAHVTQSWSRERVNGSGALVVNDLTLQGPAIALTGLTTNLKLSGLAPLKSTEPFQVAATSLYYILPMRNLAASAEFPGDGNLKIAQAGMSLAGGRLGVENATIPIDGRPASFTMGVTGLDLGAMIAQAKVEGLTATGRLSGTLPLRRDGADWVIAGGKLASTAPGMVSYRPASAPAALVNAGETVLKALSNFQYDSIAATVNGAVMKELKVTLAMKGKNPDLYGGYPISFTLNLGGALGAVLKQGIAGYNIGSDLVERLQSEQLREQ